MPNYRITLQYDGGRYHGWQRQARGGPTIQGKLEETLTRMIGTPVNVIGASRTDAGVHADAQVANFHLPGAYPCGELTAGFARYLPEDIVVRDVVEVDERFHSRYLAKGKWYRYRVCTLPYPNVFTRRFAAHASGPLDGAAMRAAAAHLTGTLDFRSLSAQKGGGKTTTKTVHAVEVGEGVGELRIDFVADGFLLHMARIVAGLLLEIGGGRLSPDGVPAILERPARAGEAPTAPAKGLALMRVFYDEAAVRRCVISLRCAGPTRSSP